MNAITWPQTGSLIGVSLFGKEYPIYIPVVDIAMEEERFIAVDETVGAWMHVERMEGKFVVLDLFYERHGPYLDMSCLAEAKRRWKGF